MTESKFSCTASEIGLIAITHYPTWLGFDQLISVLVLSELEYRST